MLGLRTGSNSIAVSIRNGQNESTWLAFFEPSETIESFAKATFTVAVRMFLRLNRKYAESRISKDTMQRSNNFCTGPNCIGRHFTVVPEGDFLLKID